MYYTLTNPTSSKTFLSLLIQKVIKKRLYYYNLLYINNLQFFWHFKYWTLLFGYDSLFEQQNSQIFKSVQLHIKQMKPWSHYILNSSIFFCVNLFSIVVFLHEYDNFVLLCKDIFYNIKNPFFFSSFAIKCNYYLLVHGIYNCM